MSTWIDFKELRSKLDFEQVLRHFSVQVKRRGDQHHGFCPLPGHKGSKNSPSLSVNLKRGIFQCFGCGAKGNVLDFAALMQNVDPRNGAELRKVAVELEKRFCPEVETDRGTKQPPPKKPQSPQAKNLHVVVNAPLDFELKGLDRKHPYLPSRGFTHDTIEHFGLGFCSRGFLKDRLAIPLNGHDTKLIGYAGRVVDDATIGEENPRYRFPGTRERGGTVYEFRKSLFLYNGFRFRELLDDVIVVEGFTSVWWLWQSGLPNVVATMGSDCSAKQAELIVSLVKPEGRAWLLGDGDPAGDRHAHSLLTQIAPHRLTRWVRLPEGKQATDLSSEELTGLGGCFCRNKGPA